MSHYNLEEAAKFLLRTDHLHLSTVGCFVYPLVHRPSLYDRISWLECPHFPAIQMQLDDSLGDNEKVETAGSMHYTLRSRFECHNCSGRPVRRTK